MEKAEFTGRCWGSRCLYTGVDERLLVKVEQEGSKTATYTEHDTPLLRKQSTVLHPAKRVARGLAWFIRLPS